jgi:hypothetical protein
LFAFQLSKYTITAMEEFSERRHLALEYYKEQYEYANTATNERAGDGEDEID